jgi:hemolysin III
MPPHSHKHTSYPTIEERINVASHALGFLLSIAAFVLLVVKANGALQTVSVAVFASSMIALYGSSTIYHGTTHIARRSWLRTLDHAMIYVLIAGSYTPFALLVLTGNTGWAIFGISWAMAITGIVIKLYHTGRYDKISTAMYVFMGWVIVLAINPLIDNMTSAGLAWLFAGGVSYTVGALFYSIKKMPYGHAVFHVFVLLGSVCHFVSVYWYVLAPI